MYILRKGSKEICKSRHLRDCAKKLNFLAGFKVLDSVQGEFVDRVCWINYKDYTLIYKEK